VFRRHRSRQCSHIAGANLSGATHSPRPPCLASPARAAGRRAAAQRNDWRGLHELLRRYDPLIRTVVASFRLPYGCERDEIAQEARLGLLGAIRAWRPARGPFGALAAHCWEKRVAARDALAAPFTA
jgi:Sigma-70 region 2